MKRAALYIFLIGSITTSCSSYKGINPLRKLTPVNNTHVEKENINELDMIVIPEVEQEGEAEFIDMEAFDIEIEIQRIEEENEILPLEIKRDFTIEDSSKTASNEVEKV
ncbi:MAG: hypothetical protein MK078_14675 [Crocinitomicaceae bacterium]|nr:hypothetical protein [Crocinitomicaceae bacterium]